MDDEQFTEQTDLEDDAYESELAYEQKLIEEYIAKGYVDLEDSPYRGSNWWQASQKVYILKITYKKADMITNEQRQRIHNMLDDINAEHATRDCLCLFCESIEVNARVGIVHANDCVILAARYAPEQESAR